MNKRKRLKYARDRKKKKMYGKLEKMGGFFFPELRKEACVIGVVVSNFMFQSRLVEEVS